MRTYEVNFDGLVGPTHNYAGLSHGNEASIHHRGGESNPRKAALQGLAKMRAMLDLGLVQGIIPPHQRPSMHHLRRLGFEGDDTKILSDVARFSPALLARVSSASSMWVANAGTVTPSSDSTDGRLHITPANLASNFHRALEVEQSARTLKAIFPMAAHHDALPTHATLGDEGAANHMRICTSHGEKGIEVFVYGAEMLKQGGLRPLKYPARQSLEASRLIARNHQLGPADVRFVQQNPDVIDRGVFHNDVIAVANENVLFTHEDAFVDGASLKADLSECIEGFVAIEVPSSEVSVEEAVSTYLFNSQLVTADEGMVLVTPIECAESETVNAYLTRLADGGGPVHRVMHFDLRESMRNGGGPACLRLRVALTEDELRGVAPGCLLNHDAIIRLEVWVEQHYRDRLAPEDLADPALLVEGERALDELTQMLGLGSIYPFQLES